MRTPTLLLVTALFAACSSKVDDKPKATVKDAKDVPADIADTPEGGPKLDKASSSIGFIGAKVTDDHEGTFSDFTAAVALDGDTPTSLTIKVKTDSVQVEPEKLRNHLKSADFFDTAKFPDAAFRSRKIEAKADGAATHLVEGVLDLRGEKKDISFPATITIDKTNVKGRAEFSINRKDFGIVYAGMADDLIKDDVVLKIDLAFTR
ncbi:MAG TPA: YceI family protein [Nannocystaceae bacterium]|nr:YceI family protein [Nannocystaceae bacterium]